MTFNARPGKNKLVSLNDDGSIVAVNAKFVDKVESFKTGDDRSEVHVYFISDVTGESTELCTTTVSPKEADKFIADVNAAKN